MTSKTPFFNLKMNVLRENEVLQICEHSLESDKALVIFFVNAHCFNIAQNDPEYLKTVNNADLLLNDGIGLKLASYFTPVRFPENLNGTDLIPKILRNASGYDAGVYFLGGKEHVPGKAAERAREMFPGFRIAGYHSGYFDEIEEEKIIQEINHTGAKILVIGMGVPKQEFWVAVNKIRLKNVRVIIAGGAILDFLAREIPRAPLWMRRLYLEWLFRLFLEPRRMWKRYLVGNLKFFYYVIRDALPKKNGV